MKESRLIIIVLIILSIIVGPIAFLANNFCFCYDWISFSTNIYCGIIVGLITSICQYWSAKRKIINNVYSLYFDIYRLYYYSKNKSFLGHYASYSVYKKIDELNPKINESLDEYCGFFRKYDKTYKKLNPRIQLYKYKAKNIFKSLICWFNKNKFNYIFSPIMKEIEKILISIDKIRFLKDKEEMIKMFNYIWEK